MELVTGLDTQIFVIFLGVVVALGCTLVAFLVDYLKGKNERLREQVLEMTVRQEERARYPQQQLDSNAVLSAIAQVGRNLENVVRSAVHGDASPETVAAAGPVYQSRPPAYERRVAQVPFVYPVAPPVALVELPAEVAAAPVLPPVPHVAPTLSPAEIPSIAEAPVVTQIQTPEPDWRTATWHQAPIIQEVAQENVAVPEPAPLVESLERSEVPSEITDVITPTREALRSLFESPSSIANASRLAFERRLDETIPETAAPVPVEEVPVAEVLPSWEFPVPEADTPEAHTPEAHTEEPVVRIRVLNSNVASPSPDQALHEDHHQPALESASLDHAPEALAEAAPEIVAEAAVATPQLVEEESVENLPVAAPVDFLTAADLGEATVPAPHESFDSLMAAVNAEPGVAPAEQLALAEAETPSEPGVLALPGGMNDRATLDFLKRDKALFTGLIVSIGINDYARLQETSGRPAAEELAKSVSQLVKSLITAPNGSEFFGCRSSDDEFIVVFANENGSVAQRRLNGLSERLWDFQLRSLGNFSVMFSWGATEANGETFADAVEAASERMRETRHNRRTISMEKTRLKKVVNG